MQSVRDNLEHHQVSIYFGAVLAAVAVAAAGWSGVGLAVAINPALAWMLYVTFLQVPLVDLGRAWGHVRFLLALVLANFVAVPLLLVALWPWLPADALVRTGMLLVLLAPCIDYVVTFAHMGRADARLLLAATPVLLLLQMLLLPVYLGLFLGEQQWLLDMRPLAEAFGWLIVLPLLLAAATQLWAARSPWGQRCSQVLGLLPVPATAVVLWVVMATALPQLGQARAVVWAVLPGYVAFALLAPCLGWCVARALRLPAAASRAVAFSASTRNSLVVLPLALSIPGALPLMPVIIVSQTLVELISELVYVKWLPRWGRGSTAR